MRFARILCLFSVLLLTLAGCAAAPAAPQSPLADHSGQYDTTANITYRELQATATITRQSPGSCNVTFTAPESLRDLSFLFLRDSVDVTYKGLGFQFDPQSLPGGAVAKMATGAINQAMQEEGVSLNLTEGGMEISGILEAGAFSLRLDSETGNLLKLSVPSEELEIEFINFRFLD